MKHEYGFAWKNFPLKQGETAVYSDGSKLAVHDIMRPLPSWMHDIDVLFTDSPWNTGNLHSFYTKAEDDSFDKLYGTSGFSIFIERLFECVKEINPDQCWLEIGKQHLADYIVNMRSHYKHVTFINSTYYHNRANLCYVVVGSKKPLRGLKLDGMDEEDIISEMAARAPENAVIGDLCMGLGLVACAAYKTDHRFLGTELNPKRLSATMQRLNALGASYNIERTN